MMIISSRIDNESVMRTDSLGALCASNCKFAARNSKRSLEVEQLDLT